MVNSTLWLSFNDTAFLVDGFMFATNFSGHVTTYANCKTHHFNLGNSLIDLLYNIKDFSQFSDWPTALATLFNSLGNVFIGTFNNYVHCQSYSIEIPQLFDVIKAYVTDENYFRTFYTNIMNNSYFFLSQWSKTVAMYQGKKFYEAGKAFGELFMVVIFPEIKEVKKTRMLQSSPVHDEKGYFELINCVVKESGLTFPDIKGLKLEKIVPMIPQMKQAFRNCLAKI